MSGLGKSELYLGDLALKVNQFVRCQRPGRRRAGEHDLHARLPRPASQPVAVLVVCDGEKPWQKGGVVAKQVRVSRGSHPGLLEQILGPGTGETGKIAPEPCVVELVQAIKGAGAPCAQGKDQLAIALHTSH